MPGSGFGTRQLLSAMVQLPQASGFVVGFSGGADSTALLHALARGRDALGTSIRATHFHHGLQPEADHWSAHCKQFCADRCIPFSAHHLDIAGKTSSNFEEIARNSRYQIIAELLGPEEIYLTAHHADDQAETVFLNLMRGSGAAGLAGIPEVRKLGQGWVARPLLNWNRQDLIDYLERHHINWMRDPSNQDDSFDRNYLRNQLFPQIEARWPGLSKRLNRSARISRITSEALVNYINAASGDLIGNPHRLSLLPLLDLELAMQTLVIRQWLRLQEIPAPPEVRLFEFLDQLTASSPGSSSEVCWGNWRIKRYRNNLWLQDLSTDLACRQIDWIEGCNVDLGDGLGRLMIKPGNTLIPPGWQVDARREGERIQIKPRASRQSLKECFRQSGIPPWLRVSIPVLYWNSEVVAVGDWLVAEKLKRWLSAHGAEYVWQPANPLLQELRQNFH